MVEARRQGGVAVLSFSPIISDRRVLRQCDLLARMGHPPLVIAYADPGETIPFALAAWPVPRVSTARRLWTTARQVPAHLGLMAAKAGFWAEPRNRWALEQLRQARPRLLIANDWQALVVAACYRAETGAKLHYDSHEFATREFEERAWWRLVYQPMVRRLEHHAIAQADTVSTVGPKLALALQAEHGLATTPAVVRSIPDRIALPPTAPPHWPLRLLYHGAVLPHRGIELAFEALAVTTVAHRLTIRGNGPAAYLDRLKAQAGRLGLGERVTFVPAVPADQVMPAAASGSDVGLFTPPLDTEQRSLSLPNKLFEYIGAGLAVIVTPGDDLREIVTRHGVGVVTDDEGVGALVTALDGLTPERVAAYKQAARIAGAELCWEIEQERLAAILRPHLA